MNNPTRHNFSSIKKTNIQSSFLFVAIGVCAAAVGYGVYSYRNKGNMSTSVYLMQLRVGAQGAAVGVLTIGLLYAMTSQYLLKKD